jgi:Arc/MetJ-type ribon-helix-helix transcriptional regulator
MPTQKRVQTSVKLPRATLNQIRDLAEHWGPVSRLSQADVIIEAVQRSWQQMKAEEQERARALEAAAASRDHRQSAYGPLSGKITSFGF